MKSFKKLHKKRKRYLSFLKFKKLFATERACRKFLFEKRWPGGFVCPKCGNDKYYYIRKDHRYQCTKCRKQTSVTAGTIFHRTHLPLRYWFWAIYIVSRFKRGISALSLKKVLDISYPTAWFLLHKIREAMNQGEESWDHAFNGVIMLNEAFFKGRTKKKKCGGADSSNIIVAIGLNHNQQLPFTMFSVVKDFSGKSMPPEFRDVINTGSMIRAEDYKNMNSFKEYLNQIFVSWDKPDITDAVLHWAHIILSNAKSYISGTYRRSPGKYLPRYLAEFSYRFNKRFGKYLSFTKLITDCIIRGPVLQSKVTAQLN